MKPVQSSKRARLCSLLCATVVLVGLASPQVVSAQTLLHDYNFGNNSGVDSVGHANGTLLGGATITGHALNTTTTAGQGLALNGSSVTTSAVAGLTGSFTIEDFATVQNDNIGFPLLFGFSSTTSDYLLSHPYINGEGGTTTIEFRTSAFANGVSLSLGAQSGVGTEQMYAVTYNAASGVATAYLNGVATDHATLPSAFNLSTVAGSANGGIGGFDAFNDPASNGTTQNFAIYSGALSGAQIATDMPAMFPNPPPGRRWVSGELWPARPVPVPTARSPVHHVIARQAAQVFVEERPSAYPRPRFLIQPT